MFCEKVFSGLDITQIQNCLAHLGRLSPNRMEVCQNFFDYTQSLDDELAVGYGHYMMELCYSSYLGKSRQLLFHGNRAISIFKKHRQYRPLVHCYINLLAESMTSGSVDTMTNYIYQLHQYMPMLEDPYWEGVLEYYTGAVHFLFGSHVVALTHENRAIKIISEHSSNDFELAYLIIPYCMAGEIQVISHNDDVALEIYQQFLDAGKKYAKNFIHDNHPDIPLIFLFKIMASHLRGDYAQRDSYIMEFTTRLISLPIVPGALLHSIQLCSYLIEIDALDFVGAILPLVTAAVEEHGHPFPKTYLADLMVSYYAKIGDEAKHLEALQYCYEAHCQNRAVAQENQAIALTQRREYETAKALADELKVAEASSAAKTNFLSNMSHEIRTPINAILGMNEMVLREAQEENILEYANNIQSAGVTLLGLVNDILDTSKLDAGKMEILPVVYDISSVINDLVNMATPKSEEKGLELILDIDPALPRILYGDEIRIKQCALNILTNAVKYTEKGSVTLRIGYHKAPADAVIPSTLADGDDRIKGYCSLDVEIIDTGIGIKDEDRERLFSRYDRIEEGRNRNVEGTGLGMSIVTSLLDLMEGTLDIKSEYGKGSDFSFSVMQGIVDASPLGDYSRAFMDLAKNQKKYRASFVAPEARILVVDDTPVNLSVVKGLLKPLQIQIDTAESGKAALGLLSKNTYDIAFIDHMMPEMDGIETLAKAKELPENKNRDIPYVALTANAVSGARETYLEAGFSEYLSKPIDSQKLESLLSRLLAEEKTQEVSVEVTEDAVPKPSAAPAASDIGYQDLSSSPIPGIDISLGLTNCVTEDIYRQTLSDFLLSIETEPDAIADFLKEGDLKNYTIKVHALKSSARLIGASKLSSEAAYLEACGNAADEAEIRRLTPALLEKYKSYEGAIRSYLGEDADASDEGKEPIDPDMLEQALAAIKEFASAFDFDSAEETLSMLKDYSLPEEKKELVAKLTKSVRNVDYDGIMELL